MDKIVHFEIPADDEGRAQKFYTDVFGWHANAMPQMGYTIFHTGPTDDKNGMPKEVGFINGGMFKRSDLNPVKAPSFAIDVKNIDEATEKVKGAGGSIVKEKTAVGDMGFIVYFKDPEGNILSLWQNAVK